MSQVKDYITKNIETVNVEENLETLAKKMAKQDIGFLPVLDNGNYVGVITDRDIVIKGVAQSLNTAQQVMTKNVVTGDSEMETDEAVNLLQKHNIYRLLIVDDNKITGVVTLGDLGEENAEQLIGKVVSKVSDSNSNN
ncbi:CBS domain-containing protein [Staphylococcus sp. mip270_02]